MFDESPKLPPGATPSPGALLWAPAGEPVAIRIDYDVIDRLGAAVMAGFGRVPKRGAEIGGILLGTVERDSGTVVHISDFASVPSEHRWGPSYQLSDTDKQHFDTALTEAATAPDRPIHAVGYFRSHTREPFQLVLDDVDLLDARFPQPEAVCLLIRPYPTRVPDAAFVTRTEGRFATDPPSVLLPFRRRELGGGKPERSRRVAPPQATMPTAAVATPRPVEWHTVEAERSPAMIADAAPNRHDNPAERVAPLSATRPALWTGAAYAAACLALGLLAGAQLAVRFMKQPSAPAAQTEPAPQLLPLRLAAASGPRGVTLRWTLPAVVERDARGADLQIVDGLTVKSIPLSRNDLLRGALRYRNQEPQGSMRLEVDLGGQNAVVESTAWTPDAAR